MRTFDQYAEERDSRLDQEGRALVDAFDAYYAVGTALARARAERKFTQTELSARAGVAQSDISLIERGMMAPTTPTLLKLTSAMHVRIAFQLLNDDEVEVSPDREVLLTHS